ncbi:uncharacterized protein G2W53_044697 [Senna tora]|uniref:Uncharacterized protein n=1 Tax=Senna tora TaxID=362788 RepID=A0A834SD11_9FABA|nr:uncharacterized protein G2W53_044697 [Senna tora]
MIADKARDMKERAFGQGRTEDSRQRTNSRAVLQVKCPRQNKKISITNLIHFSSFPGQACSIGRKVDK